MLADGAPRACDASQMIQRATSMTLGSSLNVADQTAVLTPSERNADSSSTSSCAIRNAGAGQRRQELGD